jgi:hypothetical protein
MLAGTVEQVGAIKGRSVVDSSSLLSRHFNLIRASQSVIQPYCQSNFYVASAIHNPIVFLCPGATDPFLVSGGGYLPVLSGSDALAGADLL